MRLDTLTQSGGRWVLAIAVVSLLGLFACNEADGTPRVPGKYPPEEEINRPGPAGGGNRPTGDGDGDTTTDDAGTPDAAMGDGG